MHNPVSITCEILKNGKYLIKIYLFQVKIIFVFALYFSNFDYYISSNSC